jgi:hypothetical protein
LWIGGVVVAVVAGVAIGMVSGVLGGSSRWPSATYTGAPVEAADTADGVTIVGLGDSIAYVPVPGGRDVTSSLEFDGATGPAANADDVVAAHTISSGNGEGVQIVVVLGNWGPSTDDPRDRFATTLREVYGLEVTDLSGSVEPVTTAQGLVGAVAVDHSEAEGLDVYVTRVILGRGPNTAVVEWTRMGAPPDAAALQRLLDTVRIDD